jgi:hypothetical protein
MTPTPIPAKAYTASIYGTVVNAKTGKPIQGATISLLLQPHSTTSDALGRYRLVFPGGIDAAVSVYKQGYAGTVSMGKIPGRTSTRVNFKLTPIVKGQSVPPPPPGLFGKP